MFWQFDPFKIILCWQLFTNLVFSISTILINLLINIMRYVITFSKLKTTSSFIVERLEIYSVLLIAWMQSFRCCFTNSPIVIVLKKHWKHYILTHLRFVDVSYCAHFWLHISFWMWIIWDWTLISIAILSLQNGRSNS